MRFLPVTPVETAITGKQSAVFDMFPIMPSIVGGERVHCALVMSDDLTLSCFLLSCQLSGQTGRLLSQRRGGIYGSTQAGGHHTLLPPFLRTNPSKEGADSRQRRGEIERRWREPL